MGQRSSRSEGFRDLYATHEVMSGHTLKHILAAIGLTFLWWMVRTREEESVAITSRSVTDSSLEFQKTL